LSCFFRNELWKMEYLNASDVKLFAVKVTPKCMGVNGMLTAGVC